MGRVKVPLAFKGEEIGSGLLDSISSGLYVNPLHIIREYVQNSFDAEADEVFVDIDTQERELRIIDNGYGMDQDELRNSIRIGLSSKDHTKQVGWRGIGLWSALSVAGKVEISSRRKNDPFLNTIIIDCKSIKAKISPNKNIVDLINDYTEQYREEKGKSTQFTAASLKDVDPAFINMLISQESLTFLGRTLPVTFADDFRWGDDIEDFIDAHDDYRTITVTLKIDGEAIPLFKPYSDDVELPNKETIQDTNGNVIAVAWYCVNKTSKKITDSGISGLIFRYRNFAVGDKNKVKQLASRGDLMEWGFGEIVVTNPALRISTERTDFENSDAKKLLEEAVELFLKNSYEKTCRKKSERGAADKKIRDIETNYSDISGKTKTAKKDIQVNYLKELDDMRTEALKQAKKASQSHSQRAKKIASAIDELKEDLAIPDEQLEKTKQRMARRAAKTDSFLRQCMKSPILGSSESQSIVRIFVKSIENELGKNDPIAQNILRNASKDLQVEFKPTIKKVVSAFEDKKR